jgi:hypothetical protein
MADNRDLKHGEKRMALFTSEKGRDRANAQRQIEGLNQNDKIIALLTGLLVEQQQANLLSQRQCEQNDRTNQLLEWLGTSVLPQRTSGGLGSRDADTDGGPVA